MVEIDNSFEDNGKLDQMNRKLEEILPDPEKCRTENEDPNFPFQKAVQYPGKNRVQAMIRLNPIFLKGVAKI
jgi:hypothetical protein